MSDFKDTLVGITVFAAGAASAVGVSMALDLWNEKALSDEALDVLRQVIMSESRLKVIGEKLSTRVEAATRPLYNETVAKFKRNKNALAFRAKWAFIIENIVD